MSENFLNRLREVLYAGFLRGIDDSDRAGFNRQVCGIAGAGNTNVMRRCFK